MRIKGACTQISKNNAAFDLIECLLLCSGLGKMLARGAFLEWSIRVLVLGGSVCLAGCSFLPSQGPSGSRIEEQAANAKTPQPGLTSEPYQLITVTSDVITTLKASEGISSDSGISTLASLPAKEVKTESLFRVTGMAGLPLPPRQTVAAGDVLNVTIYESGGGLFGPLVPGTAQQGAAGAGVGSGNLPPQTVDESGQITVPFAGRIQAIGRTPYEIEQEIVSRLKNKTIDPQAIVTLTGRKGGDLVTVTGDVKQPTLIPVSMAGTKLLDALSAAGGEVGEAHETTITVVRGSVARSELLSDVLGDPRKNIKLQAGDTVILRNRPWNYLAFGAVGKTGSFTFGSPDLSMADALAKSGGPLDERAEPIVYLYRLESTKFVKQMGIQPKIKAAAIPVIYQLDLRTPQGFFLAQRFSIRNKDIVFFANADSVGVLKFFGVVNALTAPARTGLSTATGVDTTFGN